MDMGIGPLLPIDVRGPGGNGLLMPGGIKGETPGLGGSIPD